MSSGCFIRREAPSRNDLGWIYFWFIDRRVLGVSFLRIVWFVVAVPGIFVPGSGAVVGGLVAPVVATATAGGGFGLPLVLTRPGAALVVVATSGAVVVLITGGVVVVVALGVLCR